MKRQLYHIRKITRQIYQQLFNDNILLKSIIQEEQYKEEDNIVLNSTSSHDDNEPVAYDSSSEKGNIN